MSDNQTQGQDPSAMQPTTPEQRRDFRKPFRDFVDWSFKFASWCVATTATMAYAKKTGSAIIQLASYTMIGLIAIFVILYIISPISALAESGTIFGDRKSETVTKWIMRVAGFAIGAMTFIACDYLLQQWT